MLEDADITNLVSFATILLQEGRPREDYKELLELWVIALGKSPLRGIKFKSPGAMHRVRWMAKLIYAIKLFLFRHQLRMSARAERGSFTFVKFIAHVYLMVWFTAPLGIYLLVWTLHT